MTYLYNSNNNNKTTLAKTTTITVPTLTLTLTLIVTILLVIFLLLVVIIIIIVVKSIIPTMMTIDTHDKQKDLGVTFDSKLTFDQHISQVVNKATKMTKIIRRTFQFLDKHTFLPLYKTMVRSHLDYAMAVWHPYKIKHKIALENIQRRATKELPGMRDLSYIERLKLLKLPTLAYRRLRGDMIEVYKIIHNIYDHESVPHLLKNNEISQRTGNRGHSLKLFTQKPN